VNYAETLKYLYGLQKFGMKLGLRNIRSLLKSVGNPEKKFPSIHIAGTNGKGSTAAMLASILQAAGYNVGLYTSPHLVKFTERVKINAHAITDDQVVAYTRQLKPKADELKPTFFEVTTAIAFLHFADEQIDVAVIETGLGGRLDATNVLRPLLSIITNIGLEHTEHLGATLGRIASEKAGIMKRGVTCLVGEMKPSAQKSLRRAAKSKGVRLTPTTAVSEIEVLQEDLSGIKLNLKTPKREYPNLRVSLGGDFQAENARLAVLAAESIAAEKSIRRRPGNEFHIKSNHIYTGLKRIRQNTGFRGRLEVVLRNPRIVLDVAHNADAMDRLTRTLENLSLRNLIVVFGVMKDKNYEEMIRSLGRISKELIAVKPRIDRAVESRMIVEFARSLGISASDTRSVRSGMAIAIKKARMSDAVLVTGSHYVVGEALEALEGHG
jgi:dihydrofolate synthase/folylpolyglutamate synthase